MKLRVGDRVRVVKIIQDEIAGDSDPDMQDYVGQEGTITRVWESDPAKVTVDTMPTVRFDDGLADSFWPQELQGILEQVPTNVEPNEVRVVIQQGEIVAVRFGMHLHEARVRIVRETTRVRKGKTMMACKLTRRMYEEHRSRLLARQRELDRLVRTLGDGQEKRKAQMELARLRVPPALPRPLAWQIFDIEGDYMGTTHDMAEARQYRRQGLKVVTVTDAYPGGRELPRSYRKYMEN